MPSTHIQKFFTSRDNRVDNPDEFVGQEGRLWYDPDTNTIRVYTGDPGGMAVGGGGTGNPGGSNRAVQFNDSGGFGGESAFTYNKLTDTLTISNAVNSGLFIGSGANLTNLPAANLVGSVPLAAAVSNNAQPNITSVGTLTSLTMGGNILTNANVTYSIGNTTNRFKDIWLASSTIYMGNITLSADTNNLVVSGNVVAPVVKVTQQIIVPANADMIANGNVDFTHSPYINLGNVNTVHISGGNSGYVLSTDGASNLSWVAQSGGNGGNSANANYANFAGTSFNVNASNIVGTVANANYSLYSSVVLTGNQSLITGLGTLTSLTTSGNIYANTGTVYGNLFAGDGGLLTNIAAAAGTYLVNGTSNVAVLPNGNVTFKVANTANVVTVTNNSLRVVGTTYFGNLATGNYLTSTLGCVTIGSGTVVTTGNTAGIFNSSINNINLGLQSNVTMGSITGTVTARGNLVANSISAINLTATGAVNFTGTNLLVNTLTSQGLISSKQSIQVDIDTIVDSFLITTYRSVKYTFRVGADEGYQAIEVLLVHDGINSIVTIYGSLSTTGDDLIMLSTEIQGDTVYLFGTGLGTNVTVNYIGTYIPD